MSLSKQPAGSIEVNTPSHAAMRVWNVGEIRAHILAYYFAGRIFHMHSNDCPKRFGKRSEGCHIAIFLLHLNALKYAQSVFLAKATFRRLGCLDSDRKQGEPFTFGPAASKLLGAIKHFEIQRHNAHDLITCLKGVNHQGRGPLVRIIGKWGSFDHTDPERREIEALRKLGLGIMSIELVYIVRIVEQDELSARESRLRPSRRSSLYKPRILYDTILRLGIDGTLTIFTRDQTLFEEAKTQLAPSLIDPDAPATSIEWVVDERKAFWKL